MTEKLKCKDTILRTYIFMTRVEKSFKYFKNLKTTFGVCLIDSPINAVFARWKGE